MLAPERYLLAVLVSTQRWAPPALVLVGVIAWIWATPVIGGGTTATGNDTIHVTLVALFALAAWLGHATATSEEPALELISTSTRGSATRMLLAKWSTATTLAAVSPLLLLTGTYLADLGNPQPGQFSPAQATAATLTLLVTAAAAAALGVLVASILPAHPGWSATILILATLTQATPWSAPVPPLATALPGPGEPLSSALALTLTATTLLTATLLTTARILRRPANQPS